MDGVIMFPESEAVLFAYSPRLSVDVVCLPEPLC